MRILIVLNILNDSRSISGGLIEYVNMANAWIEAGHQTDFLAAKATAPIFERLTPKSRLINSDGIFDATRYLSKTWLYFPAYAYRMLTAHWVHSEEPYDIVYSSSQFIVDVYTARVLARRQHAKFVVKIQHVLAGRPARTGFINRLLLWSERTSARWINRRADLLLCLSSTVGRHYEEIEKSLGMTPRQIVASGCGIDVNRFSLIPTSPKNFDVVVLGRLHEQKGIFELPKVLQEIVAHIPGARMLIIGEGPHRQAAEQLFAELGLKESVQFTGGIPEADKNKLLGQSKIGLSLSYEEGWGLSITEFLAIGLPVVAYELPVFEEVFPNQLDLVCPRDAKGAAAKVITLLKDPALRAVRGQSGKQFVARYDYRRMAQAELARLKAICT
jgi:glycosyltransferase involved in cell wall biosynthesis